jgi:transcriptional regulator with XRE-family HTH domain
MERRQLMSIGGRLGSARKALGLSQQELADLAGYPKGRIGQWECGNRNPGTEPLKAMAEALGASISWLVLGQGEPRATGQPNAVLLEACVEHAMTTASPEALPATIADLYVRACAAGLGLGSATKADLQVAIQVLVGT